MSGADFDAARAPDPAAGPGATAGPGGTAGPAAEAHVARAAREARAARHRDRRRRAALAALTVLGLFVLILALLSLVRRPPPPAYFESFSLTEYDQLPPNPFASQDAHALTRHFPGAVTHPHNQDRIRLDAAFAALAALGSPHARGGPPSPDVPLLVHLCAHAWTDGRQVFLIPGEAAPGDPAQAVPLDRLLLALKASPARHKMLLLDVARPTAGTFSGLLLDDVARLVDRQAAAAGDDLVILTACSPGQVSLPCEPAGLSAFAFYLDRGLEGAADGYPDSRPDGHIAVAELAAFVHDHVDRWAWHTHGLRQTPRLFGRDDFSLTAAAVPRDDPAWDPPAPDVADEAWNELDRVAGPALRLAPRHLRRLENDLLRAEQFRRAGAPHAESLFGSARTRARDLGRLGHEPPAGPWSLADAARLAPPDPAQAERNLRAVRDLLRKLDQPSPPGKPPETAAVPPPEIFKEQPTDRLAAAVLDALAETLNPRIETLLALDRTLGDPPAYVETAVLRQMLNPPDPGPDGRPPPWPGPTVAAAVQATRAFERAAAAADPGSLDWGRLAGALDRAADLRRKAEAMLTARPPDPHAAARAWRDAASQAAAADDLVRAYAHAWDAYERLLDLLVDAGPLAAERDDLETWRAAVQVARRAGDAFQAAEPLALPALAELHRQLDDQLDRLGAPFDDNALARLVEDAGRTGLERPQALAVAREIDLRLRTPRPWADQRAELADARREQARRLHQEVRNLDRQDARQHSRPAEPSPDSTASARPRRRAVARAEVSLTLAALAGLTPDAETRLRDRLREAAAAPADEAAAPWLDLARQLRQAWDDLPPLPDKKDLLAADRRNRILGAAAGTGGADGADGPTDADPTSRLRRQRAYDYWTWRAAQYDAESRAPRTPHGPAGLYRRAADDCRRRAEQCAAPFP